MSDNIIRIPGKFIVIKRFLAHTAVTATHQQQLVISMHKKQKIFKNTNTYFDSTNFRECFSRLYKVTAL